MVEDLEQGDVAETVKTFFEEGKRSTPLKKSTLSIQEVIPQRSGAGRLKQPRLHAVQQKFRSLQAKIK